MKKKQDVVVTVSGGFDPLHIGHVRMFKKAKSFGDKLIVILNNDNWLINKKGFVFMPQKERAELILSIGCVDDVYITKHKKGDTDRSVSKALKHLRPDVFANGGDRKKGNTPEGMLCKELEIRAIYGIGHSGKVQSSSWLTEKFFLNKQKKIKPAVRRLR